MTKRAVTIIYECGAPKELFCENWADVPEELKEFAKGGLGCSGGGLPGTWCHGTITSCHWAMPPVTEIDELMKVPE